jgi:uncharacterized protein DUF2800
METHAFCSPSAWQRWSTCPGSPALEENEPDVPSEFAKEGRLAHELSAELLSGVKFVDVPPTLFDGVNAYVKGVHDRVDAYKLAGAKSVRLMVEQKLDISEVTGEKNAIGTADAVFLAEFDDGAVLEVRDLKFGMGVQVSAERNGQLMIYALGAFRKYGLLVDFKEIVISIHQPRLFEKPSEWQLSPKELLEFGEEVREKAQFALSLRGSTEALVNLVPGPHCHNTFCKVAYRCPALAQSVHQEVYGEFQQMDDKDAVPLEPENRLTAPGNLSALLSRFMSRVPMIEAWCRSIRAQVETELVDGRAIPGYKLVLGRAGPRTWTDEDAVVKLLIADGQSPDKILTPRKPISPTQLEKVIKGAPILETLRELTKQSEGKPSVAPVDDPREPYVAQAANDFDSHDGSDLV